MGNEAMTTNPTLLFNTPVESAVRTLVLLTEGFPVVSDLQRLVYYDYLLVHSEDGGGPESLHPATPMRSGELIVRRELIEQGLLLLQARGLVTKKFGADGVQYLATETAGGFIQLLESEYARKIKIRATWVISAYSDKASDDISAFFAENLDQWGADFTYSHGVTEDDQ